MKYIYTLLSQLIRNGQVRVDIPALDMDHLARLSREHNARLLREAQGLTYSDELTDREKVAALQELLGEE